MTFEYRNGSLHAEAVDLNQLAADYGTPLYVYSAHQIRANWKQFADHWPQPHQLCYAVKANSNLGVLNLLAKLGAGFDIVSGGELARVIAAGGQASATVFSGVGKSREEIAYALEQGIGCFNVESEAELERINDIARAQGVLAPVSFRVNPDVDAQTHPYIATGLKANKFGIAMQQVKAVIRRGAEMSHVQVKGVDCHIGSQILTTQPFLDAADRMLQLITEVRAEGIQITHLDMGGGVGIPYQQEQSPAVSEYLQALIEKASMFENLTLMLEPGRAIVGNAGVLLSQVEYYKPGEEKNFLLVDAGMNDLLRPALYQAYHQIVAVNEARESSPSDRLVDVVGPVCETGDFFGHARHLSANQDDIIAILNAGAYGFTMSSNYNTRPRAAEVMVDGDQVHVVRQREILEDLWKGESIMGAKQ